MSKKLKILLIILLFVVLITFNKFAGSQVKNGFYCASSFLSRVFWKAGENVSDFFGAIFISNALKRENQEQQRQNFVLLKELADLRALKEENNDLRKALVLKSERKFELFLSEVLAENTGNDSLLITGGKNDGLSENMPLITKEGILIGRIKECFPDFSQIFLITNPATVFDIETYPLASSVRGEEKTADEEKIMGVAKGKGGLKLGLELIPKDKEVAKGNIVLTTTLGGNFPKGLLVGEIKEIRKSHAEPFQEGEIEPYFVRTSLEKLFVITNFAGYRVGD